MISVPSFSAPIEEHVDWIELTATAKSFYSWSDYQRDLRIGISATEADQQLGTTDEPFERLVDDLGSEIAARARACSGRTHCYPFENRLEGVERVRSSAVAYHFQLLLSVYGHDAGPVGLDGAKLFEDLSAHALRTYLAGDDPNSASGFVFGFPRRVGPAGFGDALDELCRQLAEGGLHRETTRSKQLKDAGLDIVAWCPFPDCRPGQLIVFGQCATGIEYQDKLNLRPAEWCRLWMCDPPLVTPITAFFTPRRVRAHRWRETNTYGGIVFDRCRTAWFAQWLDPSLIRDLTDWSRCVWQKVTGRHAA